MLRSGFAAGGVEMADFPGIGGYRDPGFAAAASGKALVQKAVVRRFLFLVLRGALCEVSALDQLRPLGRHGGVLGRLSSAFRWELAAFVPSSASAAFLPDFGSEGFFTSISDACVSVFGHDLLGRLRRLARMGPFRLYDGFRFGRFLA